MSPAEPPTDPGVTRYTLFEVAWEVCNKVGGIHTVVSTKARTLVSRFGDAYVAVGPWLLAEQKHADPFDPEPGFERFEDGCRAQGVPVKVGRWRIPGTPRTILVEFSGLMERRDTVLAKLWDRHRVDSLGAGWDYVEPVLFGHAAGIVIERWWRENLAGFHGRVVAQFHEWMTGAGLLHLAGTVPEIGTVFTTHATVVGRAIASTGAVPEDGLGGRTAAQAADALGVRSKHSLEGAAARAADVFTTVSDATAAEAALVHGRRPDPVQPNGIDVEAIEAVVTSSSRVQSAATARRHASRFLGEDVSDACLVCISGRYEFHNKGIDVALDALGLLNGRPGRRVVFFLFVPAGNAGIRREVEERIRGPGPLPVGPIGIATHNLFDAEKDPIQRRCAERGLTNAPGSRIKVIHVPIYLHPGDGMLDRPYEAVIEAMDLTCFPSFYEPWGYTPQESLAVGIPTITSCCAGFGGWAEANGVGVRDGVFVLRRRHVTDADASARLAEILGSFLAADHDSERWAATCRATARRTSWSELVASQYEAFSRAVDRAQDRSGRRPASAFAPEGRPAAPAAVAGGRPRFVRIDVATAVPEPLRALERLARNLWWTAEPAARALFEEVSPGTFAACGGNAVRLLRETREEDLRRCASDPGFVSRLAEVAGRFDAAVAPRSSEAVGGLARPVAYFCAEYGLDASLPLYGGGLGVLAGDHLRSASDAGLPLVAVGLLYRRGYFRQHVTAAGEQTASDATVEPRDLPLDLVTDRAGAAIDVAIRLPARELHVRAWRALVGSVPLFLLDPDVAANRPEDRTIAHRLYDGEEERRLLQEIVLGRGGVRLLTQLGIEASVTHLNEGHAAFAALERLGQLVHHHGMTFDEAREVVRAGTVFTTHTPVAAGHDRFAEELIRRHFSDAATWIGAPWERFWALGSAPDDPGRFHMTLLALRCAGTVNAVSVRHGAVTKHLLAPRFPGVLEDEIPVVAITNGVHLGMWTAPEVRTLLGAADRPLAGDDFARAAPALDDAALWRTRCTARDRMIERLRARVAAESSARREKPAFRRRVLAGLDPRALYVGFARRFVPYKRADLILQEPERLALLLGSDERPVRLVISGKAHPRDGAGQAILRRIADAARSDAFAGRILLLEDYDIALARELVQGCDVWLGTPVRGEEASGTSGMKSALNGGLNLSVADGWWAEAAGGANGWTVAEPGEPAADAARIAELDAGDLYRILEEEIVPLFFARDPGGIPRAWLDRIRRSLATIPAAFDSARMVADYLRKGYAPAAAAAARLAGDDFAGARARARERRRIRRGFAGVRIVRAQTTAADRMRAGDVVVAEAEVDLATLAPEDVAVELVAARRSGAAEAHGIDVVALAPEREPAGPSRRFTGQYVVRDSGALDLGIRVRAGNDGGLDPLHPDLVLWA